MLEKLYYTVYVMFGFLIAFLGGADSMLQAVIIFVILDIITGVLNAGLACKINKEKIYKGLVKKVSLFILIGLSHVVDTLVLQDGQAYFRTVSILLILSHEGISITQNLALIGAPIPNKLLTLFENLGKEKKD